MSRLRLQKLCIDNIIVLCVSRSKCDMLLFKEEIDANASCIVKNAEHDLDDKECSGSASLNPKNPEFHQPPKRKHTPITSDLPPNNKTLTNVVLPSRDTFTFRTTPDTTAASTAAAHITITTDQAPGTLMTSATSDTETLLPLRPPTVLAKIALSLSLTPQPKPSAYFKMIV